jgi:ABC-2 type transport system permease protein
MQGVLHAISDALPMSYAVDAVHHLSRQRALGGALALDLAVVFAFGLGAVALGALTLQRRTE